MAGLDKREQREALPEPQAPRLCGLNHSRERTLFSLRAMFADHVCFAIDITAATIIQCIPGLGALFYALFSVTFYIHTDSFPFI